MKASLERLSGIMYLVIFAIFGGILWIFGGLALNLIEDVLYALGSSSSQDRGLMMILQVVGVLTLVIGVLSLAFGTLAVFRRKPWVWTFGVALYVAMILLSIISIVLGNDFTRAFFIAIIICGIILIELFTSDTRRAFGKA